MFEEYSRATILSYTRKYIPLVEDEVLASEEPLLRSSAHRAVASCTAVRRLLVLPRAQSSIAVTPSSCRRGVLSVGGVSLEIALDAAGKLQHLRPGCIGVAVPSDQRGRQLAPHPARAIHQHPLSSVEAGRQGGGSGVATDRARVRKGCVACHSIGITMMHARAVKGCEFGVISRYSNKVVGFRAGRCGIAGPRYLSEDYA